MVSRHAPRAAALDPIERASRDELQALQLRRMRWSLRHAYDHVPHYRRSFDAAGVHPDDLKVLSDLAKFPFTTKQDLRDHYPFGLFAVPRDRLMRVHASSGTTGKPTVVGYTANDISTWADVVARSIRAAGGAPARRHARPGGTGPRGGSVDYPAAMVAEARHHGYTTPEQLARYHAGPWQRSTNPHRKAEA